MLNRKLMKKMRFLLLLTFLMNYYVLFAQKQVKIDPYLKYAYYLYHANNSLDTLGLDKEEKQKIKNKGRAQEIKFKNWGLNLKKKDSKVGAIIEFDGNIVDLYAIEVNVRSKIGNIYTVDIPLKYYKGKASFIHVWS